MIARAAAWAFVAAFCYAVWSYGSNWKSPLPGISSPVLSQLPPLPAGCGEGCKQ